MGAVSAIAPHICIRELECISPIPIVSAIEAIRGELRTRYLRKMALFGTRFVIESRLFGMLEDTDVHVPPPEQVTEIHEAYMRAMRCEERARETLCRIACDTPEDAIVLAGTDLSEVFDASNTPFPFVDCAGAHARAIKRALHQD